MSGLVRAPLALLGLVVGGLPAGAAEPTVLVRALDEGLAADARAEAWLPDRVADLLAEALRGLGADVPQRSISGVPVWPTERPSGGVSAVVWGRAEPPAPASGRAEVRIELRVRTATRSFGPLRVRGKADALDALVAELAGRVAAGLDLPARPPPRLAVAADDPLLVHRLLGEAARELSAGDARRAWVKFDRVAELRKNAVLPEAIAAGRLARAAIETQVGQRHDRADLAHSALERADVALGRGRPEAAVPDLVTFLRYTPRPALAWTLDAPLRADDRPVEARDGWWWIDVVGPSGLTRIGLDPISGAIREAAPGSGRLVAAVGGQPILHLGDELVRSGAEGLRWRRRLPFPPDPGPWASLGGQLAVVGGGRVAWLDTGLGTLGQVAVGARLLAVGPDGLVVEQGTGDARSLALLRPGRATPAWTVPLQGAESLRVSAVRGRVLVLATRGLLLKDAECADGPVLSILDARDGRRRGAILTVPAGARWLGAHGRYAALALPDDGVRVFDVLAGVETARLRGPGRPVAAVGTPTGVAVLHADGDLLRWERDGVLLDRARVPGRPHALVPGAVGRGPTALTSRGLFAFGELASDGSPRDVEVAIRLVEALSQLGEKAAALRVADHWAARSVGQVEAIERLRAGLLGAGAAADWARQRAEAARDPRRALPVFLAGGR